MDKMFKRFYKGFYLGTNFIPVKPIGQAVYPGDFFQIRNGNMLRLGNIYWNNIVRKENCQLGANTFEHLRNWYVSEAVSQAYTEKETGEGSFENVNFSKKIMAFNAPGSYFFYGEQPKSLKILNWAEIQAGLIIKLTQTLFSFRELYVVTETASTANWTLAISNSDKGELEIITESERSGYLGFVDFEKAKTIQSKDIEYYYKENHRKPMFFKAKKLKVQQEPQDVFISQLIDQEVSMSDWANDFFNNDFYSESGVLTNQNPVRSQANVLDMLQANELNPNTAQQYFTWADANLDDIELLFRSYAS